MRDDGIEERDASPPDNDRVLVRPYIPQPADEALPAGALGAEDAYRLPESGESTGDDDWSGDDDWAAAPHTMDADPPTAPLPVVSPGPGRPDPALDERDRRQVLWLVGVGLAIAVAAVAGLIALWPRGEEAPPPTSAAPPEAATAQPGATPSSAAAGAPAPSAPPATATTGATTSRPTGQAAAPGATEPATGGDTATRPPAGAPAPPQTTAPTLAPPPAADRVGPITAPGGRCLDASGGIVFLGSPLAVQNCNGTLSQRWTLATDGTLRAGGSCATADGDGAVEFGACGDAASGQWRAGPGGTLVNVDSGRCLTDPSNGGENAAQVRLNACGGTGQRWTLP